MLRTMGGPSHLRVLGAPVVLTGLMLLFALGASSISGVRGFYLIRAYAGAGLAITFLSTLIWMFIEIARLAVARAKQPIKRISSELQDRWKLLILPSIVFPVFLTAYTTAKTSIFSLAGFEWDQFWADLDFVLFGRDPWRITHALIGPAVSVAWAWIYSVGWGLALFFSSAFIALFADRRRVATYFASMTAAWLTGGAMLAYGTSAAGPVFAHLFDPELGARFEPLRESLATLLPADNSIRTTQSYLATSAGTTMAIKGGGISAMPSMHLAACTIYVMAAIGNRWLVPTLLFWIIIFVGSVHFGYHYAVDGLVAAAIAIPCWVAAEAYYRGTASGSQPSPVPQVTAG